MPQYRATVGRDGVISLPGTLRRRLRIKEGQEVEFFLTLDGDVFFHAIGGKAKDWTGKFEVETRSPPFSIREMDLSVGEAVTEDDRRIRRVAGRKPLLRNRHAAE